MLWRVPGGPESGLKTKPLRTSASLCAFLQRLGQPLQLLLSALHSPGSFLYLLLVSLGLPLEACLLQLSFQVVVTLHNMAIAPAQCNSIWQQLRSTSSTKEAYCHQSATAASQRIEQKFTALGHTCQEITATKLRANWLATIGYAAWHPRHCRKFQALASKQSNRSSATSIVCARLPPASSLP